MTSCNARSGCVFAFFVHDAFKSRAVGANLKSCSSSATCFPVVLPVDLAFQNAEVVKRYLREGGTYGIARFEVHHNICPRRRMKCERQPFVLHTDGVSVGSSCRSKLRDHRGESSRRRLRWITWPQPQGHIIAADQGTSSPNMYSQPAFRLSGSSTACTARMRFRCVQGRSILSTAWRALLMSTFMTKTLFLTAGLHRLFQHAAQGVDTVYLRSQGKTASRTD